MGGSRKVLLIVLCEGMLLSCVYAWACFLMPVAGKQPFPLLEGALILALATIITTVHRGRGWRIITVIVFHLAGFLMGASRMVYVHFEWPYSFWSGEWISTLPAQQGSFMGWLIIFLILFCAAALWIGGIRIALNPSGKTVIGSRFDLGLAFFLLLLLIQVLMMEKGMSLNHSGKSEFSFLAFFMFALLGLGMESSGNDGERGYMASYRGIGVILSFVMLLILFGGGMVILFMPALTSAANLGHSLIKAVAGPVLPVMVYVLRVIMVKGCRRGVKMPPGDSKDEAGPDFSFSGVGVPGFLETILIWGSIGLTLLLMAAMLLFAAWWLIRWLASRSGVSENRLNLREMILRWMSLVKTLLLYLITRIPRRRQGKRGAGYHYAMLLNWGSHCGLTHTSTETPLEYGSRLLKHFPMLGRDIALIIDLFNQSVYGVIAPDAGHLTDARLAMKRLRRPALWPMRLKTWFLAGS